MLEVRRVFDPHVCIWPADNPAATIEVNSTLDDDVVTVRFRRIVTSREFIGW